jgi:methylated-DNA-[protein]-cysteine S-methyltransferase
VFGPRIFSYLTLIGRISITEDGDGRITGVYLPSSNLPAMEEEETDAIAEAARQISDYLSGASKEFDVEVAIDGTEFRLDVLAAIRSIPYGEVRSYSQVAEMAGHPKAFRAVGTVCAENPVPIIIPCHRVVPSSGGIGSYSGGTALKRKLQNLELMFDDRSPGQAHGVERRGQCAFRRQAGPGEGQHPRGEDPPDKGAGEGDIE